MTQPADKPILDLEKAPSWAVSLSECMQEGFTKLGANIELVTNDVSLIKDRLAIVESRASDLEQRANSNSMRARGMSEADLTRDAELAKERFAREALAKEVAVLDAKTDAQTAILARLDKVASNPAVKAVLHAILTALAAYLATKGFR